MTSWNLEIFFVPWLTIQAPDGRSLEMFLCWIVLLSDLNSIDCDNLNNLASLSLSPPPFSRRQGQTIHVPNWFSGHSLTVSRVVTSANSYYGDEIEEDERVEGVWRPSLWLELEARWEGFTGDISANGLGIGLCVEFF